MITFASHQARAGMAGASEDFEQMLGLLVRATSGEANLVFANPGDWGIDVLVGDLRGRVTVWQAKYFTRGVGRSQQGQIAESFGSALRAAARHGYTVERWVLCIPASMDGPTTRWWQGWKAEQERDTGVVIGLWDETRLRELLLRPAAADVRRHFYNPYRRDGQPGAPSPAAPAGDDPTVPRRGTGIRRRTVVIAAAGASAAGLLAARGALGNSVPTRVPVWTFATDAAVCCTPTVAGGIVYIGNGNGLVYALQAGDGMLHWQQRIGTGPASIFSRPAVVGDTVYVGSPGGLCALDRATGQLRWTYAAASYVLSGITAADGILYFGSKNRNVYAVDAATGLRRWHFPTGADVQSTPAVADGTVYVGSSDAYVYALDAASGEQKWRFPTGEFVHSSPVVAGGVVYIGSGDQSVYALDAATGRTLWRHSTGGYIQFSGPAVADGIVYVGSMDGKVYALEAAASGRPRWIRALGKPIEGSPVVSAGTLYIGCSDNKLYALDAATGDIRWAYSSRGDIQRDPAVAGGRVYAGSGDNTIYAFSTARSS